VYFLSDQSINISSGSACLQLFAVSARLNVNTGLPQFSSSSTKQWCWWS